MRNRRQTWNGRQTEKIWKQYHQELRNYVESRVADTQNIDDIMQELLIEVYADPTQYFGDENPLISLYRTARKVILRSYCEYNEIEEMIGQVIEKEEEQRTSKLITSILLPVCLKVKTKKKNNF